MHPGSPNHAPDRGAVEEAFHGAFRTECLYSFVPPSMTVRGAAHDCGAMQTIMIRNCCEPSGPRRFFGLRRSPLLLLCLIVVGSQPASGQPGNGGIFGIGTTSCYGWTHYPITQQIIPPWILGFWSALNVSNNTSVGYSIDGPSIIAEMWQRCLAEPTKPLMAVEVDLYLRLKGEGR